MSVLSLYIPVISNTTSEAYIRKIFNQKKIGNILRVDFVKNLEKNRREAFIHFDEWFDTEESKKLKEQIMSSNSNTRFVYNDSGKFWPLLVNKNAHRRVNNPNYETIKTKDVNNDIKMSITFPEGAKDKKKSAPAKKQKTYASVVSVKC